MQFMVARGSMRRTSRAWWALSLAVTLSLSACQAAAAAGSNGSHSALQPDQLDWLREPEGGWEVWDIPANDLRALGGADGVQSAASGDDDAGAHARRKAKSRARLPAVGCWHLARCHCMPRGTEIQIQSVTHPRHTRLLSTLPCQPPLLLPAVCNSPVDYRPGCR